MNDADMADRIRRFSVHDEGLQEKAVEVYRHMRRYCPVSRSEAHGGFWMFSNYRDVFEAEHTKGIFSSFPVTIPPFGNAVPMVPIEMDPPEHGKYRTVVGRQFGRAAVAAREPQIRSVVTEILDQLADRSEVDLVQDVAERLPLRVLLDLYMDIPRADQPALAESFVQMLTPDGALSDEDLIRARLTAGMTCQTVLAKLLVQRRANPDGTDLITALVHAQVEGKPLTDDEVLGFLLLLIPAGFDTTASTLGQIFLHLATRPDVHRRLVNDPTILPTAIEEFLRLTSAVTGQARTVTRDCTFAQTSLARGDRVVLLWAAANRDESVFGDPDELNMERSPNRHLAFGSGAHRCLGAHLARLQLRVMLEEFLRRMPLVHLAPGKPPVHHAGETWGLRSLPVVLAGPVSLSAGAE